MKQRQNKKNRIRLVLRYLILAILGIVLGLNLYWFNAANLTGNQVPMPFGYGASVVLSGSMEPTLSVGDLILIREEEQYHTDDMVVYQTGRTAVVHRVVSIDEETVITRGDANNGNDEPFSVSLIKGKVFVAIPRLGHAVLALKSPAGIIATLAAAILLLEMSFHGEKKRKETEKEKIKEEIRRLAEELKQECETETMEEGGTDEE